jgi:hypothetical protein
VLHCGCSIRNCQAGREITRMLELSMSWELLVTFEPEEDRVWVLRMINLKEKRKTEGSKVNWVVTATV